jgi:hypothetical protein
LTVRLLRNSGGPPPIWDFYKDTRAAASKLYALRRHIVQRSRMMAQALMDINDARVSPVSRAGGQVLRIAGAPR